MSQFARDVVALLDHLKLDQAIVGGTSLGANITLEVASRALEASSILEMRTRPDRLYGEIDAFLDEVWGPRMRVVKHRRTRAAAAVPSRRTAQRLSAVGGARGRRSRS